MAGLETINDVVGQKVWEELEQRLPNALDGAAKKMADTAAFFKANPISFGTQRLKEDLDWINKLRDAQKQVESVTIEVAKAQLLLAKAEKERAIAAKNLAQADLFAAKATTEKGRADKDAAAAANARSQASDRDAKREANNLRQLQKEEAQLARLTNELTNDYGLLSKAYNEAALRAKNYSLQLGANNPITLAAVAAAKKMGDTLKALDASVGQHQRNVGNYASGYNGLSMSIQQILREAPSAAVSLNTFFLAISNNLPMFFDEIQKIRIAQQAAIKESILAAKTAEDEAVARALAAGQTNAQAKAAGKLAAAEAIATTEQLQAAAAARLSAEGSAMAAGANAAQAKAAGDVAAAQTLANASQAKAPGILAQIGKSLFSINTLLTLGVLAITLFGGKLIDFFRGVNGASKEAEKANKKYAESLNSIEESSRSAAQQDIARVTVLTKLAADENQTHRTRMRSIKELQETYPATFGALTQQAILEGKLGDAVNKTTQALLDRAAYQAAEKKFAAAGERVYDLTLAQRKAQKDLTEATLEQIKADNLSRENKDKIEERGLAQAAAIDKETRAKKTLADINKDLANAQKEQLGFLKDAQEAAAKSGDALFNKDPKTPVDRSAQQESRQEDRERAARLAAEKELSEAIRANRAALAEETIQANKKIFDDESKALDARMSAYSKYYSARIQQAKLNGQKELADIVSLEAEINKVEAEPASTRSDADRALLMRKEAIAERRKGIEIKLQAELAEIQTQAAADQLRILKSASDEAVKYLESRINTLKELNSDVVLFDEQKLLQRLKKGKISIAQYEKEKKVIEDDAALSSLTTERDLLQKQLEAESLSNDAKIALENKLHDVKVKINQAELKLAEDKVKLEKSLNKQAVNDAINSAQEITGAIQQALNYRYDQQQKSFNEESKRIDDNLQKELDAIAASGKSQEEQEELVADAKGRSEAAQKQIDEDRRKAQIAAAQRSKAIAIAEIILNTAKAVSSALPNIPLALAAGISGATQLAIAVATPIPQYADGIEFHPGGKAIVGDGGERELINDGGRRYWSPSTPTVVDLNRGASVTPESDLIQMAHIEAIRAIKGPVTPEAYATEYANSFERMTGEMGNVNSNIKNLTMVVKNKKELIVDITPGGLRWGAKEHDQWTRYLNRRIHIG